MGVISYYYCDKEHHYIDKNERKKTKDTIVPKKKENILCILVTITEKRKWQVLLYATSF